MNEDRVEDTVASTLNITLFMFNEVPLCTARLPDTNDQIGAYLDGDQFTAACTAATAALVPAGGVEIVSRCIEGV